MRRRRGLLEEGGDAAGAFLELRLAERKEVGTSAPVGNGDVSMEAAAWA